MTLRSFLIGWSYKVGPLRNSLLKAVVHLADNPSKNLLNYSSGLKFSEAPFTILLWVICSIVSRVSGSSYSHRWGRAIKRSVAVLCQPEVKHCFCRVSPALGRYRAIPFVDAADLWKRRAALVSLAFLRFVQQPARPLTHLETPQASQKFAVPFWVRNRFVSFLCWPPKLPTPSVLPSTSAQSDQLFKAVTKIADTPTKTQLALRQVLGEWLALYLTEDCLPAGWSKDDGDTGRFLPSPSGADPIITCDDGLPRKGSPVTADCCSDLLELLKAPRLSSYLCSQ